MFIKINGMSFWGEGVDGKGQKGTWRGENVLFIGDILNGCSPTIYKVELKNGSKALQLMEPDISLHHGNA